MKHSIFLLLLSGIVLKLSLTGCGNESRDTDLTPEQQIAISYLDSIHALNPKKWVEEAQHLPDSVYNSQQELRIKLTPAEAKAIVEGAKKGTIPLKYLFLLEPGTSRSDVAFFEEVNDESVQVRLHDFGNNRNYAIEVVNHGWECDVYFFDHHFVVAKHHVFHKYGLEIGVLAKDADFPVIYYKQNFESGTGVWWWNYHFFRYGKDGLKPALNTLQNSNIANPGGPRMLWYEATIVNNYPLKMKVVYNVRIPGLHEMDYREIIRDSAILTYGWGGGLQPDFGKSGLTENKIKSFYLSAGELLFVHAYYHELKSIVLGKDLQKRRIIAKYLADLRKKN